MTIVGCRLSVPAMVLAATALAAPVARAQSAAPGAAAPAAPAAPAGAGLDPQDAGAGALDVPLDAAGFVDAPVEIYSMDGSADPSGLAPMDVPFIVGASRRRQTLEEAPSAVTVITREDIRRHGWRTLGAVLANVRGFYVVGDGNYTYAGVRGFLRPGDYNSRMLILINGHATNDAPFLASALGEAFGVDMASVERIEVIRGPGSAIYGTNALLGVINVVTRTGPDARHIDGVGATAALSGDTLRRAARGYLSLDRVLGEEVRVHLSGSTLHTEGRPYQLEEFADRGFPSRTERDLDHAQALRAFGLLAWGPLTVQGSVSESKKHVPTASFASIPHERLRTEDRRAFVEARLDLAPLESLDVATRVYYDHSAHEGRYPRGRGAVVRGRATGDWGGVEALVSWRAGRRLRLAGGAQAQRFFDVDLEGRLLDGRRIDQGLAYTTWAAFTDAEVRLLDGVTLSAGLRYDDLDAFGQDLSPRAAVVLQPWTGTALKLIYGRAFRAPSPYEMAWDDGRQLVNMDLEAEALTHYEVTVAHEALGGRLRLGASAFFYDVEHLITFVPVDPQAFTYRYANVDEVHAYGFEVEAEARLAHGIRLGGSYTFVEARDMRTRRRLSSSPQHLGQLRASLPLYDDRLFLAVAGRFLGERPGVEGDAHADAALTFDVTLTFDDLLPGLDCSLGATNVLDERWTTIAGQQHVQDLIPQDGRALWARLSLTF